MRNNNPGKYFELDTDRIVFLATGALILSPFYGKLATFSRHIGYFEPYAILGGGVARTEASVYPVVMPGIGLRFFFREWIALRAELRDYLFQAPVPYTTLATQLTSHYGVLFSLSFFLPKMPASPLP